MSRCRRCQRPAGHGQRLFFLRDEHQRAAFARARHLPVAVGPPALAVGQGRGLVEGHDGDDAALLEEGGQVVGAAAFDLAGAQQLGEAGQGLAGRQVQVAGDFGLGHEAAAQRTFVVLVLDGRAHQRGRAHGEHGRRRSAAGQQRGQQPPHAAACMPGRVSEQMRGRLGGGKGQGHLGACAQVEIGLLQRLRE
ncbi:hypothetical protein Ajs_0036 [Acidovorax sp. JS42]|nr:hypothetical protein Ajs_0036 [Acidovorax sp. JS42]